jgi:ribokinase
MISVLGSINVDLVALVERLPRPGETVSGQEFATSPGGKGGNQALAARRAGAVVRMVGAVGRDHFASAAVKELAAAGVNLSDVATTPDQTGTALIFVGSDGENMIAVVPGANATVSRETAFLAVSSMGVRDTLVLQMEIPVDAIEKAASTSRERGIRTILNIAPATPDITKVAGLVDIVVANETEFEILAGRPLRSDDARVDALKALYEQTRQTIVVTLGAEGVVAIHDGRLMRAPGLKIKPLDTVGAGDTFVGYLAAQIDSGVEFHCALETAAAAASMACLARGAQPAMPMLDAVKKKIRASSETPSK